MLIEYLPILVLFVLATGLAGLVILIGHAFGPRRPSERKSVPYESGMRPIGPGAHSTGLRPDTTTRRTGSRHESTAGIVPL